MACASSGIALDRIPKSVYIDLRKSMKKLKLNSLGVLALIMIRQDNHNRYATLNSNIETSSSFDLFEDSFAKPDMEATFSFDPSEDSTSNADIKLNSSFDLFEDYDEPESQKKKLPDESTFDSCSEDSEGIPILRNPVDKEKWKAYLDSSDDSCISKNEQNSPWAGADLCSTSTKCITCKDLVFRSLNQYDIKNASEDLNFFMDDNWKNYAYKMIPCDWHEESGCEICEGNSISDAYMTLIYFLSDNSICEACTYNMAQLVDQGWFHDDWERKRSFWSDSEAYQIMSQ